MIQATSTEKNFRTLLSDGEHTCCADAPISKGGEGEGFSPLALLEAALASCINITAQAFAAHHGIPLRQARTTVQIDAEQPEATVFTIQTEFEGDLTEEQKTKLRAATKACPIHKVLSKKLQFVHAG